MKLLYNKKRFRHPLLFLVSILLFSLVLAGCGGTTNDNNRNGDDNNNDNGSVENGDEKAPTDQLRDTVYHKYPGAIKVLDETETLILYTTDEPTEVMAFYSKYDKLVPVGGPAEILLNVYQTPLMLQFFKVPMNPAADDYEEKLEEWEQEFQRIIDDEGNLMMILVVTAEDRELIDFIDAVGEDYIGLIPPQAKTVIRYNFGEFDN
jgi:hypothetical protein